MNRMKCITVVTYGFAEVAVGRNNIQPRPFEAEHVLIHFGVNGSADTRDQKSFKYLVASISRSGQVVFERRGKQRER